MKTAIITGVCGQDGAYLAKHLLDEGYKVIGWARRNACTNNLSWIGIKDRISVIDIDICDPFHVTAEIEKAKPDEIYNLAAQSHVGISFNSPMQTCQVNYGGYLNILLAARRAVPACKIYQAGTSEMFGYASEKAANEQTPLMPMSPYAIAKTAAHWAGVNARFEANQFVCNGILFNHESPLRGKDFVTRKITKFVADYHRTGAGTLWLGNLSSMRDWGHARDYVKAMHAMMQYYAPLDFVVATGQTMTVRNFVILAFAAIDKHIVFAGNGMDEVGYIDGKAVVAVSKEFYRPNDLTFLKGDPGKAKRLLNWQPETNIGQLVDEMVQEDLRRTA